jgi:hypothetical protein
MTPPPLSPPPVLDSARVIEYAVLNASVAYTGRSTGSDFDSYALTD